MRKITLIDIFNPTKLRDWLNNINVTPVNISQTTGQSTTSVMSQKAVTDALPTPFAIDVYNWTGSQQITTDEYLEVTSLPLVNNLDGGVSEIISNLIKLPAIDKQTGVFVTIRVTGTTPTQNPDAEWFVQLRRPNDTIVTSVGAARIANNNTLDNRESFISSYTNGLDDPFHTDGFKISIQNKTNATLTITSISMRISRVPA